MAGRAVWKIEFFLHSFQSEIDRSPCLHGVLSSLKSVLRQYVSSTRGCNYGTTVAIDEVADKIVDLIESMVPSDDESESPNDEINNPDLIFTGQLLQLRQEIICLKNIEVHTELQQVEEDGVRSSRISGSGMDNSDAVGLKDELRQLMGWLTGGTDKLNIISVTGMAGIGKTTLVNEVCKDPYLKSHFHNRIIMVTIGPYFRVRKFALDVLDQLSALDTVDRSKETGELLIYLRSVLEQQRRCLVVFNDVWDKTVWLFLERLIPENYTGSRIIYTTRLSSLARRPNTTHTHEKRFLDDNDSWALLRKMAFPSPEESCSFELEKLGKKIANNCEGLPLAIVRVGQLLCQSEKSVEYWTKVSEDENPLRIGIDDNSPVSKSLSLSYTMLPRYLKEFFLYMGVFPKGYKIFIPEIIRLCAPEGIVTQGNDIEHVVREWLDNLISYSVVLVHKLSSTSGKIKTCRVHIVFRNLCISIAQKDKFCYVLNKYAGSFPEGTILQKRLCVHNNAMLGIKAVRRKMEALPHICSLLCLGSYNPYPLRVHLNFNVLKVLNAIRIRFYVFPQEILILDELKYLAITCDGELPKHISKLQNLEILIVRQHLRIKSLEAIASYLPVEIWDLEQLKHLECMGFDLLESSTARTCLQTLSGVSARSCEERVLDKMHSLRKLGICIELGPDEEEAFSFWDNIAKHLSFLQSFKCIVSGFNYKVISQVPNLPSSITKITLSGCRFSWKCMAAIYELQRLKVLKLQCNSFSGPEWILTHKKEFRELQFLLLADLDVKNWQAESDHFPKLEHLIIRHCYKLCEIPIDFKDIETLKMIEVEDGSPYLGKSAEKIQENYQQIFSTEHLQVHIHSSWDDEKEEHQPKAIAS